MVWRFEGARVNVTQRLKYYRSFRSRRLLTTLSVRPTHPPVVSPLFYRMSPLSLSTPLGTSSKWLITHGDGAAAAQLDACEDLNSEASSLLNGFRMKTKRTVLHQVCHIWRFKRQMENDGQDLLPPHSLWLVDIFMGERRRRILKEGMELAGGRDRAIYSIVKTITIEKKPA